MRRMVVVIALGTLALCSGCVSPSERVPMNRSFAANSSWLGGARRQSVFRTHPAVREPSGFFAPSAGTGNPGSALAGATPARPLPSAGTELVARPATPKQDTLPRFFPGLFGQNQGDRDRLALARAPERAQLAQANSNVNANVNTNTNADPVSASRLRFTAQRDQIAAASKPETATTESPAADSAVRETAAEVDANDNDAPLLPVALDVKAYPVKPSASLPDRGERGENRGESVNTPDLLDEPTVPTNARPAREERPLVEKDELSTSPPREDAAYESAAPRTDRQSTPASAMISIPGLDDSRGRSAERSRPEPAAEPVQERVPTTRARSTSPDHAEHAGHAEHVHGRPQLAPTSARATTSAYPAAEPGNDKFRVTPRQGANQPQSIFEQIKQEPRRGPISRLWHRMRGEG